MHTCAELEVPALLALHIDGHGLVHQHRRCTGVAQQAVSHLLMLMPVHFIAASHFYHGAVDGQPLPLLIKPSRISVQASWLKGNIPRAPVPGRWAPLIAGAAKVEQHWEQPSNTLLGNNPHSTLLTQDTSNRVHQVLTVLILPGGVAKHERHGGHT
jgi:hypothetical protein